MKKKILNTTINELSRISINVTCLNFWNEFVTLCLTRLTIVAIVTPKNVCLVKYWSMKCCKFYGFFDKLIHFVLVKKNDAHFN